MEENDENLNTLFDSINYRNIVELNRFIDEMNMDQALFCLVRATRYAHNKGLFDIEESEVISKSIRLLTTPQPLPKKESSDE
jgi:hypothetical protein